MRVRSSPPAPLNNKELTLSQKEKYIEEYEKYKHIVVSPGDYKSNQGIPMEILSVNQENGMAEVKTKKSGVVFTKTLHWCRKYLIAPNIKT